MRARYPPITTPITAPGERWAVQEMRRAPARKFAAHEHEADRGADRAVDTREDRADEDQDRRDDQARAAARSRATSRS